MHIANVGMVNPEYDFKVLRMWIGLKCEYKYKVLSTCKNTQPQGGVTDFNILPSAPKSTEPWVQEWKQKRVPKYGYEYIQQYYKSDIYHVIIVSLFLL